MRIHSLSARGLEYDEIWTLENYARESIQKIFADLSLPNNHPLHTFAVSISIKILGDSELGVRFPAFFAGCALLVCAAFLLSYQKRYTAAFFTTLWFSLSPLFIHYSQTARGYSMQILFLFLHWFSLQEIAHKKSRLLCCSIVFFGLLSVITIPSSILYIFPATLFHTIILKQQDKEILYSHLFLLAIIILWLGINLNQFLQGQSHGSFDTWASLYKMPFFISKNLFPIALLPFFLLSLIKPQKAQSGFFFLCLCLFVIITSPVIKWGPPRVYLYLLMFYLIAAAEGISSLFSIQGKQRFCLYPLALLLSLCPFYNLQEEIHAVRGSIDWKNILPHIEKDFPQNTYCIYPVHESYPIQYYFSHKIPYSLLKRIPQAETHYLAVFRDASISCANRKTYEPILIDTSYLSFQTKQYHGMKVYHYSLKKVLPDHLPATNNLPGIWILAAGPCPQHPKTIGEAISTLDDSWCYVNLFFQTSIQEKPNFFISSELLISQTPPTEPIKRILKNPIFRLYRLQGITKDS
ncbi:MAG: glycosyltransferase family 39 protein [Candidatus Brocadiae bacterium]|nr:glycosyltransferase family 39 protein [Candidatus Brocadiia bacterium]